jgi:hypothetical protein
LGTVRPRSAIFVFRSAKLPPPETWASSSRNHGSNPS